MNATNSQDPAWFNDFSTIQRMMKEIDFGSVCPSCKMPFDKGKKRKLTDSCGHERCYMCMFNSEQCVACSNGDSKEKKANISYPLQELSETNVDRNNDTALNKCKLKLNDHFPTLMKARNDSMPYEKSCILPIHEALVDDAPNLTPAYSVESSPISFRKKFESPSPNLRQNLKSNRRLRSSSFNLENHSAVLSVLQWPAGVLRKIKSLWSLDDEESVTPPPAAETARNDLYTRLGLLLGSRSRSNYRDTSSHSSQESYASVSSLTSNDTSSVSPLSTLTGSSEADNYSITSVTSSYTSQDKNSDSTSLMSISTGNSSSGSPFSTVSRRRSVTSTSSGQSSELSHLKKSSLRHFGRRGIKEHVDPRIRFVPYRLPQIHLKPQFFEVPQQEKDPLFIGRDWLFKAVQLEIDTDAGNKKGIVIMGGSGTGKTSVVLQLVENSCFGRRQEENIYQELRSGKDSCHSSQLSLLSGSRSNLVPETVKSLGSHVVAYHFCQADNNVSCMLPEFIHNLAAQLCQAPQLAAYRALVSSDLNLQETLAIRQCIINPTNAFMKGILDPLCALKQSGKIPSRYCVIVIDSLNEAEYHRPDYGDSVTSFLIKVVPMFPTWLKVVVTIRTSFQEFVKPLKFSHISLDELASSENLQRDLLEYMNLRIFNSPSIRKNISVNGRTDTESVQNKFTQHLLCLSRGNFLFVRLALDLIESGHIVLKSSSFKVLPQTLSEIYLLRFNLKFPSVHSFEKVVVILNVCLASLYPMTLLEIYHSVNAGNTKQYLLWEEFVRRMEMLEEFLIKRQDGSFMFFHPSFREWLTHRDDNESKKFLCDPRSGHANIAFRMTRLEAPLNAEKTGELGHQILKAHIYKNSGPQLGFTSRDMQALWVSLSSADVSEAVGSLRNIYSPNVKVSRLLLLAGADPNYVTEVNGSPVLVIAAFEGHADMVALLLEFGADSSLTNVDGQNALCLAASKGHTNIVRMLFYHGSKINYMDPSGYCALTYAAANGHVGVLSFLLQNDWPSAGAAAIGFPEAAQQALVSAAANGKTQVCEYLLNLPAVGIDKPDTLLKETPLIAASRNGHKEMCHLLLRKGADIGATGLQREVHSLMIAVKEGHWEVVDLLLLNHADVNQADSFGKTSLMVAASEGHMEILELLLSKGACISQVDRDGLSALCWAAAKGQLHAVECLLEHGANINHTDNTGRTPLDFAASRGDPTVIQLFLNKGALLEHVDHQGMRPLDRAISFRNTDAILCFLRKGAKLGPTTWTMAAGKPEVLILLFTKLMEDGSFLYKKNRFVEATHRFQYALKKFPNENLGGEELTFQHLKIQFLLSLSRCKRKMNESEAAIDLINKVLEINPKSFEAYYARTRVRRDMKQKELALSDLEEALKLAPENKDIRRILENMREEIKFQDSEATNLLQLSPLTSSTLGLDSAQDEITSQ